jgi:membrane-associated phospholipid phosphatase
MLTKIEKSLHAYFLQHDAFFKTKVDSYFKWIPYAATFAAHLLGVRTKNGWLKQMMIAAAAEGIRYLTVDNIKTIVTERRPLPYTDHRSFPSGHTSSAFSGALFMYEELKDCLPVLSYTGFACGAATGVLRLVKSRHWLKDVIAGAVIGMLSAKAAYTVVNKIYSLKNRRSVSAYVKKKNYPDKIAAT